jgi:hypothetical protein
MGKDKPTKFNPHFFQKNIFIEWGLFPMLLKKIVAL